MPLSVLLSIEFVECDYFMLIGVLGAWQWQKGSADWSLEFDMLICDKQLMVYFLKYGILL